MAGARRLRHRRIRRHPVRRDLGIVGNNRRLLDPTLQALRAIPSIAWVPLFILWLGIFEASKVALIAIGVFFPVYLGVTGAILSVDRKLIEVGRVFRLSRLKMARRILLPAVLPEALTACGRASAWDSCSWWRPKSWARPKDWDICWSTASRWAGPITSWRRSSPSRSREDSPTAFWSARRNRSCAGRTRRGDALMLDLARLSKTYADGTHALADINLTVRESEIVALVGGSGCGKTTLLG